MNTSCTSFDYEFRNSVLRVPDSVDADRTDMLTVVTTLPACSQRPMSDLLQRLSDMLYRFSAAGWLDAVLGGSVDEQEVAIAMRGWLTRSKPDVEHFFRCMMLDR